MGFNYETVVANRENTNAIDNEGRAADIERHKSDSVEKAKTGRGEWKPELASQSEQATRGDKHNMTMEQMQKMAKEKGEQEGKGDK
ncbi:uncharacterized protein Z519_08523 [Cladophialophora bantiana CBS 173.52]|uniref:Uncharacterized protein n=1 Tax=Cladophialophora bantiana (strain ATCC 10958 / CBS 173.52 / CDC B-1940 / NIH 8579) TaxID=1442370 RepID=A0A0D2HJ06_CLAB1|nr:uncharacterized protein Z519_08523 [Cladophialophora bantiana CBS 173.52]KIW90740.1 hypothetical protein Z519_08523 [Cladophialophora bantiana CBS 173.52]